MAAKASVRDTGITALVPAILPLPRKGGARVGGIELRPGAVAIHAGETEADALAFVEALLASYGRMRKAEAALPLPAGNGPRNVPVPAYFRPLNASRIAEMGRELSARKAARQPVPVLAVRTVRKPSVSAREAARRAAGKLAGETQAEWRDRLMAESRAAAPVETVVEPIIVTGTPVIRAGVCPRCGRSDFRTENGRAWHVANAPDCTRYVNPGKHEYRTVAA
jgi:hypothetical protein